MPEGPQIHSYARRQRGLVGQRVAASSPQGRFPDAATIDGQILDSIEAHGKHLLYGFDPLVHVHLGMAGKWFPSKPGGEPRPAVRLRLATPEATWDLVGPTRCELFGEEERAALLARLGPDPLRRDADPELAWRRLTASRKPLGAALLDQKVIAGIGNVLRNELLFEFGLAPDASTQVVDREMFDRMWTRLVEIMRASARKGRFVFDRNAPAARSVYKQEACATCGSPIVRYEVGGRTAYVCRTCQRSA